MDYITDMIEDALRRIRNGEPEAAVWRLADAAGQLSVRLKDKHPDLLGANMPTGLGFQVTRTEWRSKVFLADNPHDQE